jgi:hypothetical protein
VVLESPRFFFLSFGKPTFGMLSDAILVSAEPGPQLGPEGRPMDAWMDKLLKSILNLDFVEVI